MSARSMPSMTKIIEHWRTQDPSWPKSVYVGWGEPFCFACGWLPPTPDSWERASRWLDRAHLHDHAFGGGPDEPHNLVPLCHLCHFDMPDSDSKDKGLQWVKDHKHCEAEWQLWTDVRLRAVTPTRTTTLTRARMKFFEAQLTATAYAK